MCCHFCFLWIGLLSFYMTFSNLKLLFLPLSYFSLLPYLAIFPHLVILFYIVILLFLLSLIFLLYFLILLSYIALVSYQSWALTYLGQHLRSSAPAIHQTTCGGQKCGKFSIVRKQQVRKVQIISAYLRPEDFQR